MIVEVCVTSVRSIENAYRAGADRVELCSALGVGGITPSIGLLEQAVKLNKLPIHCLIRPREGHFIYDAKEIAVIESDIINAKRVGCSGVVIGVLTPEFNIDIPLLKRWVEMASPMHLTFHRAFDVVAHPEKALQELIALGFHTVLTAGQEEKAESGIENLIQWHQKFGHKISIMPGSGINPSNCEQFKKAGFPAIHLSGLKVLPSIKIPPTVNCAMSFLNQELTESHYDTLQEVVKLVKD